MKNFCKHCTTKEAKVKLVAFSLESQADGFNKIDPLIICKVCDGREDGKGGVYDKAVTRLAEENITKGTE